MDKIIIGNTWYELIKYTANFLPSHLLTVNFEGKTYYGKAIPNKPKTMNNNPKQWTDKQKIEFAEYAMTSLPTVSIDELIESFVKGNEVKDYEILSFITPYMGYNDILFTKENDGEYYHPNKWIRDSYTLAYLEKQPTAKIHSVKRLTDNEVFKVGQNTDEGIIKSFYLEDNKLYLTTEGKGGRLSLNDIEKVKERIQLFTTVKGEPIFENDCYYYMDESYWPSPINEYGSSWCYAAKGKRTKSLKFKNKEDLHEYVTFNKPILSLNDLLSVWGEGENPPEYYKDALLFKLFENKAKQKLNI